MRRYKVILLLMLLRSSLLPAQRDSSLTSEFARMSAKERARIAREEGALAETDTAFQAAMRAGEEHFRAARYHDALDRFQRARNLRPHNVHPKVKIQDLQALLARQVDGSRESAEQPAPPPEQAPQPGATNAVQEAVAPAAAARKVDAHELSTPAGPPQPSTKPERSAVIEPGPPATVHVRKEGATTTPATVPLPEGHRIFREGRAVVEERVVQEVGRTVVWRKVMHPWGEVVHFRDNEAIPERRWQERFPGGQSDGTRTTGNSSRDR